MQEIKLDSSYKGTRILVGDEKRSMINGMIDLLRSREFTEISIPILQRQETFNGKVGAENKMMMFNFKDNGDRDICLAPEYTAVIQQMIGKQFMKRDTKLFYVQECFRGENPQAGRYRQFTQLGVEILNPYKESVIENLGELAEDLLKVIGIFKYDIRYGVTRGLDYYDGGKGFEISCDELGSSKQICGGGTYKNGMGFAFGIDRILNLK